MPRFVPPTLLAALVLLGLAGCRTTAPVAEPEPVPEAAELGAFESQLVGRWEMERVLDRGADATEIHNPGGDRYVVLRADGTFESGGQPYGTNTGAWSYDSEFRELVLDSDLGEADDTFWIVNVQDDVMEWAGVRTETARRFRIISRRVPS